ncbi:hypothetical protein BGP78_05265 [Pseudoalteromonas sp. MSK9-3]|nr:hypothetical protein BGP78_05265 [Pseudoalteromonas sp. MSK9-3]
MIILYIALIFLISFAFNEDFKKTFFYICIPSSYFISLELPLPFGGIICFIVFWGVFKVNKVKAMDVESVINMFLFFSLGVTFTSLLGLLNVFEGTNMYYLNWIITASLLWILLFFSKKYQKE